MLLSPLTIGLIFGLAVAGLNGLSKGLAENRWPTRVDFYSGTGLVIGAFGSTLSLLIRVLSKEGARASPEATLATTTSAPMALPAAGILGVDLGFLLLNLMLAQEVHRALKENRSPDWAGGWSMIVGFTAMALTLYLTTRS